jgi:threonine dehydrogenase-like Zn-dependent dehydrogenase
MTMNALVDSIRPTGGIGVVGVFTEKDPKSKDHLAQKGQIAFDLGKFFTKGQFMGTGQTNVKAYNRHLCNLIHAGRAKPSWIISHELSLEEAPEAYKHFDCREKGWTKVILHPTKGKAETRRQRAAHAVPESEMALAH